MKIILYEVTTTGAALIGIPHTKNFQGHHLKFKISISISLPISTSLCWTLAAFSVS
jgi:hypothetical protein